MNYLISTTYQNNSYSHIVKGLGSNEVQELFIPTNIVPIANEEIPSGFDLVVDAQWNKSKDEIKDIQIISNIPKIVDLYGWTQEIAKKLKGEKAKMDSSWGLRIIGVSSLSKPLTREQSAQILSQLQSKYTQKNQVITPKVLELVEDMKKDVKDFIARFSGYIESKDLDILESWSQDMEKFAEQGKLDDIKNRMNQIIEKMEVLEGNYVKQINTDEDKPLDQFNRELNTVMNQNRLFRYHGLNQLSGGSKFDYVLFKITSWVKLRIDAFGIEFEDFGHGITVLSKIISDVVVMGILISLCLLYIYRVFVDKNIIYPWIGFSIVALMVLLCSYTLNKKRYVSIVLMMFVVGLGYTSYQMLAINFGL